MYIEDSGLGFHKALRKTTGIGVSKKFRGSGGALSSRIMRNIRGRGSLSTKDQIIQRIKVGRSTPITARMMQKIKRETNNTVVPVKLVSDWGEPLKRQKVIKPWLVNRPQYTGKRLKNQMVPSTPSGYAEKQLKNQIVPSTPSGYTPIPTKLTAVVLQTQKDLTGKIVSAVPVRKLPPPGISETQMKRLEDRIAAISVGQRTLPPARQQSTYLPPPRPEPIVAKVVEDQVTPKKRNVVPLLIGGAALVGGFLLFKGG